METDYFSLRLSSLTADLNLSPEAIARAAQLARHTFEEQRRTGLPVSEAIEKGEAVLLEGLTPTLDAASRLKDILAADFGHVPALSRPPHFGHLLQEFMSLLTQPATRLADAYIVGLLIDYNENQLS